MIIKLLKGFTILEIVLSIVGAIIDFLFGDILNGIVLIFHAIFTIIICVPIIISYNRSLANEEKIDRLKYVDNTELKNKISSLERQIALLKNKLAISDTTSTDKVASTEPILLECPFCGKPISPDDEECTFCGFDLKNGSN